jgi:RNA polymerase sigma-70 factor, ECF subfamily
MVMAESVAQLIRASQAGDQRAFAELHARYAKMVHAILLARLPPADAEDQVQEVFLTAWTKLTQLDDPAQLGGWLAAIARNRAVECLRRRRPTEPLRADWPEVGGAASVIDRAEAQHALEAIRSLPEAYRETLTMRLCEGMSGLEIAEVTGLEYGSVRINLHRGMKMLREKLGVEGQVAAGE